MGAVADAFAAANNRLDSMRRESAERKELRGKNASEAKGKARESFSSQGPKMDKYAQHVAELVRRQKQAGGWSTGSVHDKDKQHYDFGPETDERDHEDWESSTASSGSRAASGGVNPTDTGDPAVADGGADAARAIPTRRPTARRAADDEDDDDFSSRNWLS